MLKTLAIPSANQHIGQFANGILIVTLLALCSANFFDCYLVEIFSSIQFDIFFFEALLYHSSFVFVHFFLDFFMELFINAVEAIFLELYLGFPVAVNAPAHAQFSKLL